MKKIYIPIFIIFSLTNLFLVSYFVSHKIAIEVYKTQNNTAFLFEFRTNLFERYYVALNNQGAQYAETGKREYKIIREKFVFIWTIEDYKEEIAIGGYSTVESLQSKIESEKYDKESKGYLKNELNKNN